MDHNLVHLTVANDNFEMLKKFLPKIDINQPDGNGWTPLRIACEFQSYQCIQILIGLFLFLFYFICVYIQRCHHFCDNTQRHL